MENTEFECDACHRKFKSAKSLNSHYRFCKVGTHIPKRLKQQQLKENGYKCECGKEFDNAQSLNAHYSWCLKHKELTNQKLNYINTRIRSGSNCNFSKEYLGENGVKKIHNKSRKTIENNIKVGMQYKFNFDGRIKQGWYKGFYCDSSYELVFLIYCLEHNIPIQRCTQVFKYEYKNKIRRYYPDFEINGIIYEIKGYDCELSKFKHKLFPQIKMLYKSDLKKCFDYVIQKYGKNFTELYEKNK